MLLAPAIGLVCGVCGVCACVPVELLSVLCCMTWRGAWCAQLERDVDASLQSAHGSVLAALPAVKRLEKQMVDEKLRYVKALADNPELAA